MNSEENTPSADATEETGAMVVVPLHAIEDLLIFDGGLACRECLLYATYEDGDEHFCDKHKHLAISQDSLEPVDEIEGARILNEAIVKARGGAQ